ncbi:hypothetical protein NG796_02555 [Laspinema sp. A4]|uniref:hypothetical protein n=1 Tax=Laspinema sp. D2d TaxID=2953686 RepID=UPI0021BA90D5|nr:hypothetical protein [Laspinema sp. D2d]MCT7982167.1 hypothetical protein [Laspinema sp. D2d]
MIISDLNHLEMADDNIKGGFSGTFLFGSLTVGVAIGNVAMADSQAVAIGYNGTFASSGSYTFTTHYSSQSGTSSLSVSS